MKIGLYDVDNTKFHNIALMKLSTWHKKQGDTVEKYIPLLKDTYDCVYASKVFSFTVDNTLLPKNTIKGGIGFGCYNNLDEAIEHSCPDYSLYSLDYSFGFTTRGCIRKCPWCVVPTKEGYIHKHADIEEFLKHKNLILMDNNILASDHGIAQIGKVAKLGIKLDINQGVDARLIDKQVAKQLATVKWFKPVRLACDTKSQIPTIEKAVNLLRKAGVTPKEYFCYVLVKDIDDALERCLFLDSIGVRPFAQPYRDLTNHTVISKEAQHFARWVNMRAVFKSCSWEQYKYNKSLKEGII